MQAVISNKNKAPKTGASEPEWADEKTVLKMFGLGHTPLYTLRNAGKIRSVSTTIDQSKRGKRLYHIGSIREFLASQELKQRGEVKP